MIDNVFMRTVMEGKKGAFRSLTGVWLKVDRMGGKLVISPTSEAEYNKRTSEGGQVGRLPGSPTEA